MFGIQAFLVRKKGKEMRSASRKTKKDDFPPPRVSLNQLSVTKRHDNCITPSIGLSFKQAND